MTPAGTPYAALDPALMLWTVAVIADSAQCFYELLVRRLTPGEREALWQDYIRFAELFGMPRSAAPPTYDAFRAYYRGRLASDEMYLDRRGALHRLRDRVRDPPPPRSTSRPSAFMTCSCSAASRRAVRELYGLRFGPRERLAFDAVVRAVRGGRRLVPRRSPAGTTRARSSVSPGPSGGGSSTPGQRRRCSTGSRSGSGHDTWSRLVRRGPVRRGFIRRGLVRRGLLGRALIRRGFIRRGLVRRGLLGRGLIRRVIRRSSAGGSSAGGSSAGGHPPAAETGLR